MNLLLILAILVLVWGLCAVGALRYGHYGWLAAMWAANGGMFLVAFVALFKALE